MTSSEQLPFQPHILLVEDNKGDASLLIELFGQSTFAGQLHWVMTGEDAISFVLRRDKHLDSPVVSLVLLDLNLPKMSGFEVLESIRSHPATKKLPVFILTSSSLGRDKAKATLLGANRFISKPRDLAEFEGLVSHLLDVEFPKLIDQSIQ